MNKIRDVAIIVGSTVGTWLAGVIIGKYVTGPAVCRLIGIDE